MDAEIKEYLGCLTPSELLNYLEAAICHGHYCPCECECFTPYKYRISKADLMKEVFDRLTQGY